MSEKYKTILDESASIIRIIHEGVRIRLGGREGEGNSPEYFWLFKNSSNLFSTLDER